MQQKPASRRAIYQGHIPIKVPILGREARSTSQRALASNQTDVMGHDYWGVAPPIAANYIVQ